MKRYIRSASQENVFTKYEGIKEELIESLDYGENPIYEQTSAGMHIDDLASEVEKDLNLFVEPSVQLDRGEVNIMPNDNATYDNAVKIDWNDFCDVLIDIALDVDSDEAFKTRYKSYLQDIASSIINV